MNGHAPVAARSSLTPPLRQQVNGHSARLSSATTTQLDTRVLQLLRDGNTLPEIADLIGYSLPGINKVVKRIKQRYGARTLTQAVADWVEERR